VTETEDASVRTVVVAVAANLLVAVAKGVAAVPTGSTAMFAETTHPVADTCNEGLLYVGVRHGARPKEPWVVEVAELTAVYIVDPTFRSHPPVGAGTPVRQRLAAYLAGDLVALAGFESRVQPAPDSPSGDG
jgi:hypothetical protein